MVEDVSGNQTVKCVGTYNGSKAGAVPAQIPPLIINKQVFIVRVSVNGFPSSKKKGIYSPFALRIQLVVSATSG